MVVNDFTCQNRMCTAEVRAVVSLIDGRTPLRVCKRHITWAIEFISVPDQEVKVKTLSKCWES